ncbi:MAG: hypothetical protein V4617_10395 [Gemmatimonadota bacterium]
MHTPNRSGWPQFARLVSIAQLGIVALLALPFSPMQAQVAFDRDAILLVPGETTADVTRFTVRNTGTVELEATVRLEDWSVDEQGQSHWRANGRMPQSCRGRVSVSPGVVRLGPGEQRTVHVTVNDGARFDAECWTAAVVQPTRLAARPFSVERTVMTRASVPVYVTPRGLAASGTMSAIVVRGDSVDLLFTNTGRTRADIVGVLQVRAADNTVVHSTPLAEGTVLAGGTRRYRVPMPPLPPGRFTLLGIVDFGGDAMAAAQAAVEIPRTRALAHSR